MALPTKPTKNTPPPAPKKSGKQALNDLLGALGSSSPTTSKKSSTPIVENPDLDNKINTWLEGHRKKKEGEAMMNGAETDILPTAENLRIDQCNSDGKFHSSININGRLLVTAMNKYSKIPVEAYDGLKAKFGEQQVDNYFKQEVSLEMTPEALGDEKVVKKLIEVFRGDFLKYFKLERHLKPTEAFHKDRITSNDIKVLAEDLLQEGILKPAKLTLKPCDHD